MTKETKSIDDVKVESEKELPEQVKLDQVNVEEVTQEQAASTENQPVVQQEPESIEIIVVGKQNSEKIAILANIIKNCLERDYTFRSYFEGMNVQLRQLIEPDIMKKE